jgi:hypothetical protein
LNSENFTVYKIAYSTVDEKPEARFICLKILVGERGFEPPTPWSRTRFEQLLNAVEIEVLYLIGVESVAGSSLNAVETCGFSML